MNNKSNLENTYKNIKGKFVEPDFTNIEGDGIIILEYLKYSKKEIKEFCESGTIKPKKKIKNILIRKSSINDSSNKSEFKWDKFIIYEERNEMTHKQIDEIMKIIKDRPKTNDIITINNLKQTNEL